MPQDGRRKGTRSAIELDRVVAEIAQLEGEVRRAEAEAAWLKKKTAAEIEQSLAEAAYHRGELGIQESRLPLELEQLRDQATRDRAEAAAFEARKEKTLAELELVRRELADDDADSHYARTYTFHDDVTQESVGECIAALEHWSRRFPGQSITIQLCTGGGSVFDGMALYGFVRRLISSGTEVTTVGLGWVASMGAVLLQCGSRRVLDRDAVLMIHNSIVFNLPDRLRAHEVHDESALLKKLDRQTAEILAEKSSKTPEEFLEMMDRRDVWLSAPEALELGLCDEVR